MFRRRAVFKKKKFGKLIKLELRSAIIEETIQEYNLVENENYAYNQFISTGKCRIGINLGSLMDRKNMSFEKIVDRVNSFFLLEFVCAFIDSEGQWSPSLCADGYSCNIKKILKKYTRNFDSFNDILIKNKD